MEKTIIYLIRHGEIDNPDQIMYGGNIDLPLNEKGKEQIRLLAQKIKNQTQIQKIYSSPMKRALTSAKIIANVFGLQDSIVIKNELKDVDIPALVGKPISVRQEILDRGTDEYSQEFVEKGNESRAHIVNRMSGVFDTVVRENRGGVSAIISHGDPLRFLIYALEHPGENVLSMNILYKTSYLQKGGAAKVIVGSNGQFESIAYIS